MSNNTIFGMLSILAIGPGALTLFWLTIHDWCKIDNWKWKEMVVDYCLWPFSIFLIMMISHYMLTIEEQLCLQIQSILTFIYFFILDPYNVDIYRKDGEV